MTFSRLVPLSFNYYFNLIQNIIYSDIHQAVNMIIHAVHVHMYIPYAYNGTNSEWHFILSMFFHKLDMETDSYNTMLNRPIDNSTCTKAGMINRLIN